MTLREIRVVDDEPDLETPLTQRLRKRTRCDELSPQFEGHGEDALARLHPEGDLDVVLTDIDTPVMRSLTLLTRLREAHPQLRSLIASTYGDERPGELLRRQLPATPMDKVVGAVTVAAISFADGAPASDDITVMGICYRGEG